MKKIDKNMILNWHSGEYTWVKHDDLLELCVSILNSEFYDNNESVICMRNEILEYNKEN